jgi:hypothetical protein
MPLYKKGFIPRWVVFELPWCEGHKPDRAPEPFATRDLAEAYIEEQFKFDRSMPLKFHLHKLGPAEKFYAKGK